MAPFIKLSYSLNEDLKRELMHHGVKGMKWGVRKDRRGSGHGHRRGEGNPTNADANQNQSIEKQCERELRENLKGILHTLKSDGILRLADIPRIKGPHSIENDVKAVNPRRSTRQEKYTRNCGFASLAYEMRRRGYDVEAVGAVVTNNLLTRRMFFRPKPDVYEVRAKDPAKAIAERALQWGNGSRGMVGVEWSKAGAGAHAFSFEVRNGKVHFVDAQTGQRDVTDYFAATKSVRFMRVDSLDLTNDVLSAVRKRQ